MSQSILVVDDKSSVRTLLRDYLSEHGYRVFTAENGRVALYAARHERPDIILLDIMMPEMDGYDFLRTYRAEAETPIILLTARVEETDKVVGLELGADDYVTKPFALRELLARIRAVLRRGGRAGAEEEEAVLRVGGVTLDRGQRRVLVDGREVALTPSEFALLATLMAAPGRVFSRMELLERLQGQALEGTERTVNVHVSHLRAKLEPDPANPRYVETVFGVGYRFSSE